MNIRLSRKSGSHFLFLLICAALFYCVIPAHTYAAVIINEIAWMGTAVSANDEWIELYNTGASSIDLSGWSFSDGVSLSIPLSGTIASGAYFLLERTDDTTVPGVAAGVIYTGALANDGRTLTLTTPGGAVENQVVGGSNWSSVGGDNMSKDTAQRTASGWVTAAGTPGTANASLGSAPQEEEETDVEEDTADAGSSAGSTVVSTSDDGKNHKLSMQQADRTPALSIGGDRSVHARNEVLFVAMPTGISDQLIHSLVYEWNFGDGATATGKNTSHRFIYPGTYVVSARAHFALFDATTRVTVTVLPIGLVLTRGEGGALILTNGSSREMDISGFTLTDGGRTFIFPPRTFVLSESALTLLPSLLKRQSFSDSVFIEGTAGGIIGLKSEEEEVEVASVTEETPVEAPPPPVATSTPKVSRTIIISEEAPPAKEVSPQKAAEPLALEASAIDADTPGLPSYVTYGGLGLVIMLGIIGLFLRRPES